MFPVVIVEIEKWLKKCQSKQVLLGIIFESYGGKAKLVFHIF